jgi:hypothetical protein
MTELLYDVPTGLIAAVLMLSMLMATEFGYRVGLKRRVVIGEAAKEHINGIQSSILGILALLLGFTFSLALQRFDSRSEAVVDEANAIGTAWLRTQLLPTTLRAEAQATLRAYTDLRVQASQLAEVDRAPRQALAAQATAAQNLLWAQARRGIEFDTNAYTPVLFVESVNALIDSYGKRDAALNRHVPELVLLLMHSTFLVAGGIVGFASGTGGHRPSLVSYLMIGLIVVLVFIVLDLDRPRRGLIEVSQKSLLDLQASMRAGAGPLAAVATPQRAASAAR